MEGRLDKDDNTSSPHLKFRSGEKLEKEKEKKLTGFDRTPSVRSLAVLVSTTHYQLRGRVLQVTRADQV
jgi:hypothetical protein